MIPRPVVPFEDDTGYPYLHLSVSGEFAEKAKEIVLAWAPELAGKSFHEDAQAGLRATVSSKRSSSSIQSFSKRLKRPEAGTYHLRRP
jgi:hypothetical protein